MGTSRFSKLHSLWYFLGISGGSSQAFQAVPIEMLDIWWFFLRISETISGWIFWKIPEKICDGNRRKTLVFNGKMSEKNLQGNF